MYRQTLPLWSLALLLGANGSASAVLFDDFEGYANQAAFQTSWPSWGINNSSMNLVQGFGYSGSQSVDGVAPTGGFCRNRKNLDSFTEYQGTDAAPVLFQLAIWEPSPGSPESLLARNYVELRAYAEDGLPESATPGQGTLQGLIALGVYTTPAPAVNYHVRVIGGGLNAWYALNTARAPGWHRLAALIGGTQVRFYVDDVLDTVVPLSAGPIPAFDGVVIGSGLTSGGYDVYFDDIRVEKLPEPASLFLLAAGGVWVRLRRSA